MDLSVEAAIYASHLIAILSAAIGIYSIRQYLRIARKKEEAKGITVFRYAASVVIGAISLIAILNSVCFIFGIHGFPLFKSLPRDFRSAIISYIPFYAFGFIIYFIMLSEIVLLINYIKKTDRKIKILEIIWMIFAGMCILGATSYEFIIPYIPKIENSRINDYLSVVALYALLIGLVGSLLTRFPAKIRKKVNE